jgi:hypothetical protein
MAFSAKRQASRRSGLPCRCRSHRHRLAAAGVVGHGDHPEGDLLPLALQQIFHPVEVDVPLERVERGRLEPLPDDQVAGLGVVPLQQRPGGVEVAVARHHVARLADGPEEDALGRPALVGGHEVGVAGQVPDHRLEPVEAAGPGVALVAEHDGRPLPGAHGAGARVGEPVEEHVLGPELENVELGGGEEIFPLDAGGHADGLDRLDPERLDERLRHDPWCTTSGRGIAWGP